MKSEKFEVNGIEYIRIDGVWFQYSNEEYIPLKDTILLEQLYKENYL